MQAPESIINIDINNIVPNQYQPRKNFDENALEELSISIKEYGIINPVLVRKTPTNYELIAGERRLRAAKIAGLTEIPAIVKEIDDKKMVELALIENLHRKDLNPMEEAKSYNDIMQVGNITQQDLATKLGKSQSAIANKIRLLTLPQEVQDAVTKYEISERHARCLLSIQEKDKQIEMLERIKNEKLTVKETENIINSKELNEEEIKKAINDILKSLDSENNNEEKKGDNKMNNANFFPSFDNNAGTINNNTNTNTTNTESVAPQVAVPVPEPVAIPAPVSPIAPAAIDAPLFGTAPTATPIVNNPVVDAPLFGAQPIPAPTTPTIEPLATSLLNTPIAETQAVVPPVVDTPIVEPAPTTPILAVPTEYPIKNDIVTPNLETVVAPQSNDSIVLPTIPTPNEGLTSVVENNPVGPIPSIEVPVISEMTQPTETPNKPNSSPIEIPVVTEPEVTKKEDKYTMVKEFLTNNNIAFKSYSNETNKCIIIEL